VNAPAHAPLIVTAELPQDLYSWATQLRTEHYPPERNYLKAHVTLFHALPPFIEGELRDLLARLARGAPVPARLEGVASLGRGTALKIASPAMLDLRDEIADHFRGMLTGQDDHRPRLHITVQNKVSPAEAKDLHERLQVSVTPRDFAFRGFELHAYLGGPWDMLGRWRFRG
jgi:hypothetical protein